MQLYTSKKTSINTIKLPAIYNKIDWQKIIQDWHDYTIHVWDMGCGRETSHIINFLSHYGICYHGYDPYWINEHNENYFDELFRLTWRPNNFNIFICSNVLNVICPWETTLSFKRWFIQKSDLYFISVYEGDGSGEGRESKEDCWQWNKPLRCYITNSEVERIKKDVLTPHISIDYIK